MNHQGEFIKRLLKNRKVTQQKLADDLGVSRAHIVKLLSDIYLDKDTLGTDVKILEYLGLKRSDLPKITSQDFSDWMASNVKYIDDDNKPDLSPPISLSNLRDTPNAKDIGLARTDEDGDTKLTQITPGYWGMMVELVPEYAKAGYLSSYADQEFIDDLPKHYFTVDKFVRGKYRAFEITGDSMNNGDIEEAIPDGAIVLARELKRDAWRSKLHNHTWPNWVFVHKFEGIICKQIAHQDVQNGVLTLRSLNPDKEKYPDITVYMDDLEQIYNVILRQLR